MEYLFEIYITTDTLPDTAWVNLFQSLNSLGGVLAKFEVIFFCENNIVRFFIRSKRDLSGLSNSLDGMLLRPVEEGALNLPIKFGKERFLQFVAGGNVLDLKEKYAARKARDLEYAVFRVRPIGSNGALTRAHFYFKNKAGHWTRASKLLNMLPAHLLQIDFASNSRYLKKTIPKYLDIEKSMHILNSDSQNAVFEVNTFPYFSQDYYLHLTDYEFDKHSFIVGASGSGKSKLISLFIDRLSKTGMKMNYRVIVIDPHAALAQDLEHISESKVVNFSSESTELFSGSESDVTAATELTATLFKSLLADQFNPKLDRLLRFSLFVLFTAQSMNMDNLKRFLTDLELQNQIIQHVSGYVPANIIKFFGADFNEMRTKYYNESILPIVSLVDEMQLQPTLVGEGELSLNKTIQDHFLTVFSLNKVSMGDKVVKTVSGLLIQQIFLLAQARAFNQKVILFIDEVSVVQNPALAQILAEARKFNLSVILTQQYFGQVEKDLRDAIFANVYNYYAFKVSEEDARALEGNLNIELPKSVVEEESEKGLKESDIRVKIMTELHPRECLVRVLSNGLVVPCIKARTVDVPTAAESAQAGKPQELKSYKQKQVKLPTKFDENVAKRSQIDSRVSAPPPSATSTTATTASPPTPERKEYVGSSRAASFLLSHVEPGAGEPEAKKGGFNLSELLATHSSSRLKIRGRKDK